MPLRVGLSVTSPRSFLTVGFPLLSLTQTPFSMKNNSTQKLIPQLRFPEFDGEWEEKRLGDISIKIQDGTHFSPKLYDKEKYMYITSKNVKNGYIDYRVMSYITEEAHRQIYKRCDLKKGDLLLTKDGTIGQACLSPFNEEVSLLSSVAFIRLSSNYDFSDTIMHDQVIPYRVFQKGDIKIGITGVGIELEGLVPQTLYKETIYSDPIKAANKQATFLKQEAGCHYVICLSHLGYKYRGDKVSDHDLAAGSKNIDLILGGHTHTFLKEPTMIANQAGKMVHVNQVGWAGIMLGQMEVQFEKNFKNKCVSCNPQVIK